MARANRHSLAAKEGVEPPFLDDDGHFGARIDASRDPSIRRHGHLFNVQRLAPVIFAHQDTGLQPRGSSGQLAQILLADDRHRQDDPEQERRRG